MGSFKSYVLPAGTRIGGIYQVVKEIGQGGTGVIYLAYHLHLEKYVVLKRLAVRLGSMDSLRRETDILKNLHHACLPQIYDFVEQEGQIYTVMEYVPGSDLGRYPCGSGNLPEKYLVRWMGQAADVLAYIGKHEPPIIHSDIKPENIIIRPEGDICLIDFNISIAENAAGKVFGLTAGYASPEQAMLAEAVMEGRQIQESLDARTDIYSLGATFYYLMTGREPRAGEPIPRLALLRPPGYSPGFCACIDGCTAWDRRQRFADAAHLQRALIHLERQDPAYRRYVGLRAACWLVCAGLVAAGILCIFHGRRLLAEDAYRQAVSRTVSLISDARDTEAEKAALALLNTPSFAGLLQKMPQDRADMENALGDIYFDREDFPHAAQYYGAAAETAAENGLESGTYARNRAVALACADREEEAYQILEDLPTGYGRDAAASLTQAVLSLRRGQWDAALPLAAAAWQDGPDAVLRERACRAAARACDALGDTEGEILWLSRALDERKSRETHRQIGSAYMRAAGESPFRDQAVKYAQKALASYEWLESLPDPSVEDYINHAIVLHFLGRDQEAVQALKACQADAGEDYRVNAYFALCYDAMGEDTLSGRHCALALQQYAAMEEEEKEDADAALVLRLRELEWGD